MSVAADSESMVCVQLTLAERDPILEDIIEGLLWEGDVTSFERQDDETFSEIVEDPRPRVRGSVRWRVFYPGGISPDEREAALRAMVPFEKELPTESWEISDLSFMMAWKEFFRPTQVSPRILVNPPWEIPPTWDGIRVEIDPGMAFGTGTHETTRLCLRAIDRTIQPGMRALDVGAGSGILAIAAALLGASEALAIDNDPVAVTVASEMIERNRTTQVRSEETPLDQIPGTWDMVIANILPHVLIDMRDDLVSRVAPGGVLILSGILVTESPKVDVAFAGQGLEGPETEVMGEWCAMTWRRPA